MKLNSLFVDTKPQLITEAISNKDWHITQEVRFINRTQQNHKHQKEEDH